MSQTVRDRAQEAVTLNNIGAAYFKLGEKHKALEYFNLTLPVLQAIGDKATEGKILNNIGLLYSELGQKQKALEYFNSALLLKHATNDKADEAVTLNNIGKVYFDLGQHQKANEYFKSALPLFQAVGDKAREAGIFNNIGQVYSNLGQKHKALEYVKSALPLLQALGDRPKEATILNNMGVLYFDLRQNHKALEYFNSALLLRQAVNDKAGEAVTLNNMGVLYSDFGQNHKALEYYNLALPLFQAVNDTAGEATSLGNLGTLYRDINQPTQAIPHLKQSVQITLKIRSGLQKQNRQQFLVVNDENISTLVDLLIDQRQDEQAFEWVNLFTTAELADYTRLINVKVANLQAQQALDRWNQKNQLLESLRQQLQDQYFEDLSRQIRQLEAQVYKEAENISQRFPEVAELFETKPTDIEKLKSSIPSRTVVIQPVLLKNTIAIFVLTKNQLNVVKTQIDSVVYDNLLTKYLKQLQNDGDDSYIETGSQQIYDILIRPVEDKIQSLSPKQLSIIATGKLRYLPFETLYDSKTNKFLIEKYPINYLTRISTKSLESVRIQDLARRRQQKVLAFGNPVPRDVKNLPGAEEEVKKITQLLPGSEAYLGTNATLDKFKIQALRFPLLHLATHGCFQEDDCKQLNLKKNTLLFADTQFDIADATLLGLKGTQLLTLSACQTAQQTNFNGEGVTGVAYIFERAGAEAVMASLWTVEDKATQELTIEFYHNLKQGMSKTEALQKAKLKQIHRHPYYWSPFVLIGDGR
ncbi:hypothetical protein NUACC26_054380 [Scytonema sp. NUACC26]